MIQAQYKAFLVYLMVLMIPACAAGLSLDSMADREAAVKITYSEILSTATLYKKEGRLSEDQEKRLTEAFDIVDKTLFMLSTARRANDRQNFDSSLRMITLAINAARAVLRESEQ